MYTIIASLFLDDDILFDEPPPDAPAPAIMTQTQLQLLHQTRQKFVGLGNKVRENFRKRRHDNANQQQTTASGVAAAKRPHSVASDPLERFLLLRLDFKSIENIKVMHNYTCIAMF